MSAILDAVCNNAANLQQILPASVNARVRHTIVHCINQCLPTERYRRKKSVAQTKSLYPSAVTNYLSREWERDSSAWATSNTFACIFIEAALCLTASVLVWLQSLSWLQLIRPEKFSLLTSNSRTKCFVLATCHWNTILFLFSQSKYIWASTSNKKLLKWVWHLKNF